MSKKPPKIRLRVAHDPHQAREQLVTGLLPTSRFVPQPGTGVEFQRVEAVGVDFGGSRFKTIGVEASTFVDCDFRSSWIGPGSLGDWDTIYQGCHFDKADLRDVRPGFARFEECTFDHADLKGWRATHSEFVRCHFAGALHEVKFFGAPPVPVSSSPRKRNQFEGNDFTQADIYDCSFAFGIDVAKQRWPSGPQYVRMDRVSERIKRAKQVVRQWADRERREAELMLRVYEGQWRGQQEVFARRDELPSGIPGLRERVWEALREAL